jgi:hypothetical protein
MLIFRYLDLEHPEYFKLKAVGFTSQFKSQLPHNFKPRFPLAPHVKVTIQLTLGTARESEAKK